MPSYLFTILKYPYHIVLFNIFVFYLAQWFNKPNMRSFLQGECAAHVRVFTMKNDL